MLVAAAASTSLAACATFTDNSVVARVEDVELAPEQLASLLRENIGEDAPTASLELANQIVTAFVQNEILRADLRSLGADVPPPADEMNSVSLQDDFSQALNAWQATEAPPQDRSVWGEAYARGPLLSGIVCASHILVETPEAAESVIDALDAGESFADVAAAESFDPGNSGTGGLVPCTPAQDFAAAVPQEYAQSVFDAEVGETVGPIETEVGVFVVRVRPFDEIETSELEPLLQSPATRFDLVARQLDVHVDPRYGSFEGARGVLPLG